MGRLVSALQQEVIYKTQLSASDKILGEAISARIDTLTQDVYEDIYYMLADRCPEIVGDIGYVAFYANTQNYQLSAHLSAYDSANTIKKVEIKQDSSADFYTSKPLNFSDIQDPNYDFSWTRPYYSLFGDEVYIFPEPTANLVSGAKVYFVPRSNKLTSASELSLPDMFDQVLIDGVASKTFDLLHDSENAVKYLQYYTQKREEFFQRLNPRTKDINSIRDVRYLHYYG